MEKVITEEQENEGLIVQFKQEVMKLADLDISDEQVLRGILERLVDRIEVARDGGITIYYNFKNPLLSGA